ncbi:MAG: hypothetical protein J6U84_06550 [Bacteroidales bacterium]|nr:hypothetical protein [Bacteroidales bacterium]
MYHKNNNIKTTNTNPSAFKGRRVLVFLMLLLSFSSLFAQYNVSATDKSGIKWREINTERYKLVYPQDYEDKAQELSQVLDTMLHHIGTTLGTSAPQIPILIHPYTAKSNGMTAWAPKRLEFYPTSSPTYFAYPWEWHLAIHEYRHACQFYAPYAHKGISRTLTNILGQHFLMGVNALITPNWFIEGDAVLAETALASTGRGQTPEFKNQFKAQLLEKGVYPFHKAKLESRKDFVPNDYVFGYYMSAYARNRYGKDIFSDIMKSTSTSFYRLRWFNKADSLNIKLPHRKIYAELIDSILPIWKEEYDLWTKKENKSILDTLDINKDYYTNYLNPISIGKDSVLALKTSSFEVQKLVLYTPNKEETIKKLPYLMHSYFDYKDGKVLYSQNSLDLRWEQETYADIVEIDIHKGKTKQITNNKTYFNPTYSPKNEEILYVVGGKELSYPAWNEDGERIYYIETTPKGKKIIMIDSIRHDVISPSYDNISHLKYRNNKLYFLKDVDSKYELVEFDLETNTAKQLTDTPFGIGGYCFNEEELIVSVYSGDGYFLAKTKPLNIDLDINKKTRPQIFVEELQRQEGFILPTEYDKTKKYESKEYKKYKNLFNFHSWLPIFLNLEKVNFGLGVSAFSQNLLSTSIFQVGYKHHVKDSWNEVYMTYTYSGFYPIIDLEAGYKLRLTSKNTLENEYQTGVKIGIPFSWSRRECVNKIQTDLHYTLTQMNNLYNIVGYNLSFIHGHAYATNDLTPRRGFNINFSQSTTLDQNPSYNSSLTSKLYLPFFFKNSSTELNFSLQTNKNTPNGYEFANQIDFIKGVKNQFPTQYLGGGLQAHLPLFYPDWICGGVLYVKRVSVHPFYEVGSFDNSIHQSFGNDFTFNICILGIKLPVEVGVRVGYENLNNKPFYQFLLSLK